MDDAPRTLPEGLVRLLLAVENRRRIYEAVVATPGLHLRRLSRELNLAMGVIAHHVRQLEKHRLVFSQTSGGRRSLFAVGQWNTQDAKALHALRKPERATLLHALLEGGDCGVATLAARVERPATTVSYQLRRLRDIGIVEHLRIGRESVYVITDPARIRRLIEGLHLEESAPSPDDTFSGLVDRAGTWPRTKQRTLSSPRPIVD